MARRKSDSPQKAALREMMNNYLVENVHTVLHPVFQMGIRDGIIRTNPTSGVMTEIKKALQKGKDIF